MESDQSGRVPGITAVILAAGENTRLKGLVAPYQKPLLLINGTPLIKGAINHAKEVWGATHFVIVCSPNNAREVTAICGEEPRYVIQPEPRGVVQAIELGLLSVNTKRSLIMCADNIFEELPHTHPNIGIPGLIGTSAVLSKRFTTLKITSVGQVVNLSANDDDYDEQVSWLGPILHDTSVMLNAATALTSSKSVYTVEAFIQNLALHNLESFPMSCSDLGVPEAL